MKNWKLLIVILITALSETAVAQTSAYRFLLNETSARSAAMAGSFVAMTDDPNLIFSNPAGLSTIENPERAASFGFLKNLLDVNAGYASVAIRWRDIGTIGAGIIYTNYGSFTRRDEVGNDLGSFGAGDFALLVGYSNEFAPEFFYGVNVRFIFSSIAGYHSTAAATDFGLLYLIPENGVALGASLTNLGAQLSTYAGVKERLPLDFSIGVAKQVEHLPLLLNLNFHQLNLESSSILGRFRAFTIGGEFTVSDAIRLRFGYDNARRGDLKIGATAGLAGFSIGAGILIERYRFDYAFSSLGKIGGLHRVNVTFGF
ncbi:MAG: type IX secretion system protein PorQ [Bacteroidota bacterium]